MNDKLIKMNIQRIIQLESVIHELIAKIDLGVSSVYEWDETIKAANVLNDTLGQMDADVVALIELLDE